MDELLFNYFIKTCCFSS